MGKNTNGRFVLGVETIYLKPELQHCAAFIQAVRDTAAGPDMRAEKAGSNICSVRLIESHGDCVLVLPPGGIVLAESSTAAIEMWTLPGGNILGVQASCARAEQGCCRINERMLFVAICLLIFVPHCALVCRDMLSLPLLMRWKRFMERSRPLDVYQRRRRRRRSAACGRTRTVPSL